MHGAQVVAAMEDGLPVAGPRGEGRPAGRRGFSPMAVLTELSRREGAQPLSMRQDGGPSRRTVQPR